VPVEVPPSSPHAAMRSGAIRPRSARGFMVAEGGSRARPGQAHAAGTVVPAEIAPLPRSGVSALDRGVRVCKHEPRLRVCVAFPLPPFTRM
jgi:hypothetical protein